MTQKEAEVFVQSLKWRYAKTYPQCPHEWAVLKECGSREGFVEFARLVEREGAEEFFGKTKRKYLHIATMKYWTMDTPLENTDLINRAYTSEKLNERISQFVMGSEFEFVRGMSLSDVRAKMEGRKL